MIKWVADLKSSSRALKSKLREALPAEGFVVGVEGGALQIGLEKEADRLTIEIIKSLMATLASRHFGQAAHLLWRFSGQSVFVGDLPKLVEAWGRDGDVPLLSIIRLDLGACEHRTHGLTAFVGHECAARFEDPIDARDAAVNLALLARYALGRGRLDRCQTFEGVDGRQLLIEWPEPTDVGATVKIVFPPVQNGSASG